MDALALFVLIVVAIFLTYTAITGVKRVGAHQRGVVFRFRRPLPLPGSRPPGFTLIAPYGIDRITMVDVRTGEVTVPPRAISTRDGVEVRVGAAVYYRVSDAARVAVEVPNHTLAVGKATEGALRAIARDVNLADLTGNRSEIDEELTATLATMTEQWGITISEAQVTEVIELERST
jgi:regulator of protease activity HflC (stomatin/prohibitin superfamily)